MQPRVMTLASDLGARLAVSRVLAYNGLEFGRGSPGPARADDLCRPRLNHQPTISIAFTRSDMNGDRPLPQPLFRYCEFLGYSRTNYVVKQKKSGCYLLSQNPTRDARAG